MTGASRSTATLVLAAFFLIPLLPASGVAQEDGFSLGGAIGTSVPSGDLAAFEDAGTSLGLHAGWNLSPRAELRANLSADLYQEGVNQATGFEFPDVQLYTLTGGIDYELMSPGEGDWHVSVNGAAGLTNVTSDTIRSGTDLSEFSSTYPAVGGGVDIAYAISEERRPHVEIFLSGGARVTFSDEDETARFAPFSDELDGGMGTMTRFPIEAGMTFEF